MLSACKQDEPEPDPDPTAGDGSVYVCGVVEIGTEWYARYWKNGEMVEVNSGQRPSLATAMWVNDKHVFLAGRVDEIGSVHTNPCYWVDNVMFEMDNQSGSSTSQVNDLFVVGENDVHLAGTVRGTGANDKAMYWHNGTAIDLTNGTRAAEAYGIWVDGNDVYVCGNERASNNRRVAKYWRNGVEVVLSDGKESAQAYDILVHNGVVYVCGEEEVDGGDDQAVLWVDGVRQVLSANGGKAWTLDEYKGDIYVIGASAVGGGSTELSTYWVNGVGSSTILPPAYAITGSTGYDIWANEDGVHSVQVVTTTAGSSGQYTNNTTGEIDFLGKQLFGLFIY
jgi:hypothetical protein